MNLETTIHNFETYGAALSGGSWFCAEPRVLDGVKEFGFNMLTTANNHAMDYSHAGLLKTLEYLQAAGLPTCGTAVRWPRPPRPSIWTRPAALRRDRRVLDVLSRCDGGRADAHYAGASGLNGLRFDTRYELPEAQLAQLREIAAALDLNADRRAGTLAGLSP